ncbi:TIR domain-containing protein [Micromonospora wenchangensis]|uniref:TIR domain-containing protein n=1 Tax=Micromonospora wenchangensis TaxID=1185415 RepID=UPI0037F2AFC1
MGKPRAFISFEMEDKWARDFLVQHAKSKNNDIQFVDYSVHDPFDSKWKTNCKLRIAQTAGTIVLIGATTYLSEAVLWEIAETTRQGNHMFGIQISRDHTYTIPQGLSPQRVIRWNFDSIVAELESWA